MSQPLTLAPGIPTIGPVNWNLSAPELVESAVRRNEGVLTGSGALACLTGARTGRSPKDKFFSRGPAADEIHWGPVNQAIEQEQFDRLADRISGYMQNRELFVTDAAAAADARHRLPIRLVSETAWHSLFAKCLFLPGGPLATPRSELAWTILHAPNFHCTPSVDHTRSEACVAISFDRRLVLIAGTHYAGEIKKSIFTVLNYLLPKAGVFPMHCSANIGDEGDTALFFGLSGTGKTTLSADPNRKLVGDDEHGWSEGGVFNIEGGCYAKTIRLSPEGEPQIWNALKFGCVLENVPVEMGSREPDFDSEKYTENTRAAYPIAFIPNCEPTGMGSHPTNIFFLTCDAFGVLPPLAKLSPEQAYDQFLLGYTAKVAGTEAGVTEPTATFSTCFGAPFLPMAPTRYASMLKQKLEEHQVPVWLVNTGWTGGPYGTGKRMKLSHTRALLTAALQGKLHEVEYRTDAAFGLEIPTSCPGVPGDVLDPKRTWANPADYDAQANQLAEMFAKARKQLG